MIVKETYYVQPDDSTQQVGDVFRIVAASAIAARKARPAYVATVYDRALAKRIAKLLNESEE